MKITNLDLKHQKSKIDCLVFVIVIIFLTTSLFIIKDYGPNIDSQKNFQEGEVNLTYLLTRKITNEKILFNQTHGALSFMLADGSRRVLSGYLKILDPVTARHIILPVLTSIFVFVLYNSIKKYFGAPAGITAVIALISYPEYFAHTFNNLKDIPLLIFFTLSIFSFAEWRTSNNLRYFYLFNIFWGFACSIKLYALIVPVILYAWLIFVRLDKPKQGIYLHILLGLFLAFFIFTQFYIPGLWGIKNYSDLINQILVFLKHVSLHPLKTGFTAVPLYQVLYKTPLVMLFFAWAGFALSSFELKRHPLYVLLIVWMLIPVILPCLPHITYYNGLRQFIVFLVPFSIFSAIGVTLTAELIEGVLKLKKTFLIFIFSFILIGTNLWNIVTTHPYQITFFNSLIGGLKGAQEKNFPEAWDYWLSSYRQAGIWLDKNAKPNATIYYIFYATTDKIFHKEILNYSIKRKDIKTEHLITLQDADIKGNSYVISVPIGFLKKEREYLRKYNYSTVHRVESQGGEIFTVYYKPHK